MPLVLALEPDLRQAEALAPISKRVGAELVLVSSRDAAVRALALRVPDLILVSALLSPRDEAEFTSYLQTLPDAAHLQTLSIPMLAVTPAAQPAKRRRSGSDACCRKEAARPRRGCAPEVFADEIRAYLERAGELKAQAVNRPASAARRHAALAERPNRQQIVEDPRPKPSDAARHGRTGRGSSARRRQAPIGLGMVRRSRQRPHPVRFLNRSLTAPARTGRPRQTDGPRGGA